MTMTKKQLAEVAGYTYRRLHDIDMGLPDGEKLFVKSEDGKYDLAYFVQRWVKYNISNEVDNDKSLDDVKAEHEQVKMRKTELEVMRIEGLLVDVYEVKKLWGDIAHTVMQTMLRLPTLVAAQVTGLKSKDEVARIIDSEIRNALESIADTPLPSESIQITEEDTEES